MPTYGTIGTPTSYGAATTTLAPATTYAAGYGTAATTYPTTYGTAATTYGTAATYSPTSYSTYGASYTSPTLAPASFPGG